MYYYKFIYITKFSNNTAFAIPDLHIFLDAILEVELPHLRALDGYHHHMFQCVLLEGVPQTCFDELHHTEPPLTVHTGHNEHNGFSSLLDMGRVSSTAKIRFSFGRSAS